MPPTLRARDDLTYAVAGRVDDGAHRCGPEAADTVQRNRPSAVTAPPVGKYFEPPASPMESVSAVDQQARGGTGARDRARGAPRKYRDECQYEERQQ